MPHLALLLTTFIWAATFPATKLALVQSPPLVFLELRFLVSVVVVGGGILACRYALRSDFETLRAAAISSAFLLVGYVTQTVGLQETTASNSAFITALYVVLVPLFMGRLTRRLWIALTLAVAGLWLLVRPFAGVNAGDMYTLACAAAFAMHIISIERFSRRTDPASFTFWQLVMVTMALMPAGLGWGLPSLSVAMTPTFLTALFITGALATGVAFVVQVWAQAHVPAQRVALIFALEPALAAWLAWLVLGEYMHAVAWLGSALIVAGVLMGTCSSFSAELGKVRPAAHPAK
ncbi:MAG: DMT family transporter [Nitrospirae bacterium]|nr:MAG: DMT family transporter [Nitrospirota bacterium]